MGHPVSARSAFPIRSRRADAKDVLRKFHEGCVPAAAAWSSLKAISWRVSLEFEGLTSSSGRHGQRLGQILPKKLYQLPYRLIQLKLNGAPRPERLRGPGGAPYVSVCVLTEL